MKFVKLKSRGGDYLVVASNVAWLRSYEDNQTKIGIIGSDAILVAGDIEDIAAQITQAEGQGSGKHASDWTFQVNYSNPQQSN